MVLTRIKRLLPLTLFALLMGWILVIAGLSVVYTETLLLPGCAPGLEEQPGFEPVVLASAGGRPLKGWWHAPQNGGVILLLGGLGSGRDSMLPQARLLNARGFGTLTLEPRACAGYTPTLGYREVEELERMVQFAQEKPGVTWLGVHGQSVGGVTALMGAARLPNLRAVIAEGNFHNLYGEMTVSPSYPLSAEWQVQRGVALWYFIRTGILPWQVSPLDALAKLRDRPVLLIQGEKEAWRTHPGDQLAAGGELTHLWVIPGAQHGGYLEAAPQEYERRVTGFWEEAIAR